MAKYNFAVFFGRLFQGTEIASCKDKMNALIVFN